MKPFTSEGQRYDYPLTESSSVIDAGCYEGRWSQEIYDRYHCKIIAFEPCRAFYEKCQERFKSNRDITVIHAALGASSRIDFIGVQNDSTGIFCPNRTEQIQVTSILDLAKDRKFQLMKLNVEGMEYEILDSVLEHGIARQFRDIQVQFHRNVPDCLLRVQAIRAGLAETHEPTYMEDFVWENWRLK